MTNHEQEHVLQYRQVPHDPEVAHQPPAQVEVHVQPLLVSPASVG